MTHRSGPGFGWGAPTIINAWLWKWTTHPDVQVRLFCLPFAGGSASAFRTWATHLPTKVDVIAVQLPGREARIAEPAHDRLESLVPAIADAMIPVLDKPYAIFGHSLGALVAFDLDRELRTRRIRAPERLFLSGRRAAHLPARDKPIAHLADDEFFSAVARIGGLPDGFVLEDELAQLLMPTLRADFAVSEKYDPTQAQPTPTPISAYSGVDDPWVSGLAVRAWSELTCSDFTFHALPGSHFFIRTAASRLGRLIATDLGVARASMPEPTASVDHRVESTFGRLIRSARSSATFARAHQIAFGHSSALGSKLAPLLLPRELVRWAANHLGGAPHGSVADPLDHPDDLAGHLAHWLRRQRASNRTPALQITTVATTLDTEDSSSVTALLSSCENLPQVSRVALVCVGVLPPLDMIDATSYSITAAMPCPAYQDSATVFVGELVSARAALQHEIGINRANKLLVDLQNSLSADLARPRSLVLAERNAP